MNINLIYAKSQNGVIGVNGKLPWHLPEDLKHFKDLTNGCAVIMGRKTWQSLPDKHKPLPNRFNVIISKTLTENIWNVLVCSSVESALKTLKPMGYENIWIIGGASVYDKFLPIANRVEVTVIEKDFEGDTFAPELDSSWTLVSAQSHTSTAGLNYRFEKYIKT